MLGSLPAPSEWAIIYAKWYCLTNEKGADGSFLFIQIQYLLKSKWGIA
ncbi:hypothetical protein ALT721_1050040 [Alteromonas alvinellae]